MGIPDSILLKPGPLNAEEFEIMKRHPTIARDLLSRLRFLDQSLDIPYCHHEKWDGSGYPRGVSGTSIPLPARLFSVVDVWDALRSDRPYRTSWPEERVLEHLVSLSGSHFDPEAVEAFIELRRASKKGLDPEGEVL
jgi:HD-GYP domain-containing protein (c-di-GMP phosphodiesterase class II)